MEKYIKIKEIGEPNNRLAVFVKVLEEDAVGIKHAAIYVAADANPSEQERLCEVTFCHVSDKSIRCKYTVRQLGKGSRENTHVIKQGPEILETVISADGTEKKPNEYERVD